MRPATSPAVRVEAVPGTTWSYSGGGYVVIQLVLTDFFGRSFPDLLRDEVLGPAGMAQSTFEQLLPPDRQHDVATGYESGNEPVRGRYHVYPEMAAAGLWTTPTDLARWILAIQASLDSAPGALLPPDMAAAMVHPVLHDWGLGVEVNGAGDSTVFTHTGANEGFRGILVGYVHERQGVVVMTNSSCGYMLAEEIVYAVAAEYHWKGFAPHQISTAMACR